MAWLIHCHRRIMSLEAEEITIDLTGREYLACRDAHSSTLSEIIITLGDTSRQARIINLEPTELERGIQNYTGTFKLLGNVANNMFKDK